MVREALANRIGDWVARAHRGFTYRVIQVMDVLRPTYTRLHAPVCAHCRETMDAARSTRCCFVSFEWTDVWRLRRPRSGRA